MRLGHLGRAATAGSTCFCHGTKLLSRFVCFSALGAVLNLASGEVTFG